MICAGAGSGSPNSSVNASTGSSCSSYGFHFEGPGHIWIGDPDSGTHKQRTGEIEKENNSLAFEESLCACIKNSIKNPPDYCSRRYVGGSWVFDMLSCTEKTLGLYN